LAAKENLATLALFWSPYGVQPLHALQLIEYPRGIPFEKRRYVLQSALAR